MLLKYVLNFMGEVEVKKFIVLFVFVNFSESKFIEFMFMVLVRVKFCEFVFVDMNIYNDFMKGFFIGLLLLLDVMME